MQKVTAKEMAKSRSDVLRDGSWMGRFEVFLHRARNGSETDTMRDRLPEGLAAQTRRVGKAIIKLIKMATNFCKIRLLDVIGSGLWRVGNKDARWRTADSGHAFGGVMKPR